MKQQTNKTLLFFGSFNPIHFGHIHIAKHAIQKLSFSQVWFILSPQNPFKEKEDLLSFDNRFLLLKEAQADFPFIIPCDIEKHLPQPNYTCKTLQILKEKHPQNTFSLLLGADNWQTFHRWKNYTYILKNTQIIVYPRENNTLKPPNIDTTQYNIYFLKEMPLFKISASFIRERIKKGENMQPFLSPKVYQKIQQKEFYNSILK